ncbi:MAG TPA: hypothetical protein VK204_05670 [Nocardioidaceae bacterium]|nr:hypothetical protein [Nocardioidaceae bacterium]
MNSLTSTTFRGLATGAVLSVFGAAAFAGPAAAETAVFTDTRGDISHGADIQRVRVVNDDQVRVKVVHRNLVRSFRSGSSVAVFIDTNRRHKGAEYLFHGGTYEGSDYALVRASGWKAADGQAEPMRCGYSMKLDYAKDTAFIRIDRACLDKPGAIRVEVKTGGEHVNKAGETTRTEVDWLGKPRQFTSRVKRG